ncbi:glycoside hydrolase family 35 protein [Mycena vulgaris]|nr:glycoside hydrolase family 35 protein [Mycena vulgaris]
MRLSLALASCLNVALLCARGAAQATNLTSMTDWPLHDTGFSDAVQWDHYSILINGRRTFLWAGEIHYWRIPVPAVWRDLLEKIKAAGFNGISVYAHWAFHAPNNATLDMKSGARDFALIFVIAKEVGLFVTIRGGPYVNAETTAGGFALWTTTGAYGPLRDNDPRYTAAWTPFIDEINKLTAEHQITNGGAIILTQIENEICCQRNSDGSLDTPVVDYMVDLQENARSHGVVIPIITNAPNMNTRSWSTDYLPGRGEQDMYGLDSYPLCWSCNLDECGSGSSSVAYADHFDIVSPTQPSFMPEFQGGSYNPWGGPQGGCPGNIGPNFVSMYYRHLAAERITMINLYMLYGGTNWGGLATNLVSTSYDYSSPIQESRIIGDKYSETKLIGLFFRAAEDLVMTDRTAFSTSVATTPNVGATVLRNPETQAAFYVARQSDMKSTSTVDFGLNIATKSAGNLTVPAFGNAIRLVGVQSKIIVSDFRFGNNTLVYSTAEVLSHSIIDGQSILALWLPDGEFGEFSILGGSKKREVVSGTGGGFHTVGGNLVLSYKQQTTQSVLQFDHFRVILLPRSLAYAFWAPTLTNDPIVAADQIVFVNGPYLVRSLTISDSHVVVTGDTADATTLEVFAPAGCQAIQWNGKLAATHKTSYGSLKASLGKPGLDAATLQQSLTLSGWKYTDALPEADAAYDDSNWVVADHQSTPNPTKPLTLPVLYADDYGFHSGVQIFRGRFTGQASAANLTVQGGTASGWSAWLNSDYIGSFPGIVSATSGTLALSFANATLASGENVLTVVMDHSGHDQRDAALNPRGIISAALVSASNTTFTKWTLAGNAGGESNIDPVRGAIAEGGLHAERLGWHLPGFDDSAWATRSPSEGVDNATIAFFRTTSDLAVPEGYDVSLEFILSSPAGSNLRAQLYVNGYQYGKYVPQIGHQIAFPVPPGILNVRGTNTIGLNLWSQGEGGAQVDVKWNVLGVYESSWDPGFDASALQPGWTPARLQFA